MNKINDSTYVIIIVVTFFVRNDYQTLYANIRYSKYKRRCKKRVKKKKTAVTKKCVTAVIFCGIIKL